MSYFELSGASGFKAVSGDDDSVAAFLRSFLPGLPLPDDLKNYGIDKARFEYTKTTTVGVTHPKNLKIPPPFIKTKPYPYKEVVMLPEEVNEKLTKFARVYLACRFTQNFLQYIKNPKNRVLPIVGTTTELQEKLVSYRDNPANMPFLDFRIKDAKKYYQKELTINSIKSGVFSHQLNFELFPTTTNKSAAPHQLTMAEAGWFIQDAISKCEVKLKEFFSRQKIEILRQSGYKEFNPLDDMKASENAYNLIRKYEKFVPKLYSNDGGGGGGNCTIGYGHLIHKGPCTNVDFAKYPNGISQSEAEATLGADVGIVEDIIRKHVKVMLTQNQFDALVSFLFTSGGFYPKLLAKLNAGDFEGVPAEMKDVISSNGKVANGLIPRREEETQLFSRK